MIIIMVVPNAHIKYVLYDRDCILHPNFKALMSYQTTSILSNHLYYQFLTRDQYLSSSQEIQLYVYIFIFIWHDNQSRLFRYSVAIFSCRIPSGIFIIKISYIFSKSLRLLFKNSGISILVQYFPILFNEKFNTILQH